ncbi:hypothetical protein CLV62_101496 [Dysgonomonas alginatilytica]|uniref:Uncharacterized protein n=1 Tax=Dysgonomonas alginatilytica TaxID=1605892 RepID=A0A2V3PU39_9BACT|nr:hypothetical protein [Dysgonomonas alginatilytica]PXV69227.1 hypothetical protein CLV62_101496 [Dysgonomonas alginatilytica]
MEDYRIFLGTKNETWQQALDRFLRFREAEMKNYFSKKDYSYHFSENKAYSYHPTGKVSKHYPSGFEERHAVGVPDALVDFLCSHGGFKIGDSLFEIYGEKEAEPIKTLPEILTKYGYESFLDKIGAGMLRSLSGFYFFFGVSFPESDEMTFLYFSKAGSFGKMLFSPDNPALVLQKVLPSMFNGSIDKYTLDSLISNQVDRVVVNALTVKGYID